MTRCDAWHDGHDCTQPGACRRALLAMCDRITTRAQHEQQELLDRRQRERAA